MREIEGFYRTLQVGTAISEFTARFDKIIDHLRSKMMIADYRVGKGPLKRLREEVSPMRRHLKLSNAPYKTIQFPLDDGGHDCKVWHHSSPKPKTIEITAAKGKERFYLMSNLNEFGQSRGFLGLSNKADNRMFKKYLSHEDDGYSSPEALQDMINTATIVAENKKDNRADILLVDAPLNTLPNERWQEIRNELATLFVPLSFAEVHFVSDEGDLHWQLK